MAVVITLSSDSEGEPEVEIVGSYSNKNETLPLSSVRVEVNALKITTPVPCIDLTSRGSAHAKLNTFSLDPAPVAVVDLTEDNDHFLGDNNLLSDSQTVELVADSHHQLTKDDFKSKEKSARNSRKKCKETKSCAGSRILRSPKPLLIKTSSCHRSTSVKLKRLPILENHLKELLTLDRVCVIKTGETMSLHFKQDHKDGRDCPDLYNTATLKCIKPFEGTQEKSCHGKATGSRKESPLTHCSQADNFHLEHQISHVTFTQDTGDLSTIPSPACASSSGKAQSLFPKELRAVSPSLPIGTSTVQPSLSASRNSSPAHPTTFLCEDVNSLPQTIPKCESLKVTELPEPLCGERTFDKASRSCSQTPESSPSVCKTINLDKEPFTCEDDFGVDSLLSFSWDESGEEEIEDSELYCASPTQDDKYYVCPAVVKNLLHRRADVLVDEEDCIRKPQMLCRQSLSMVYSTIEESYQDGTLELLSDLMLPGYYPPKDITSHLLWGILLNPQSPHHNCVQAFDLLMRTQRYHIADKWSAPWDWEMLSNVIEKQEHRPETVRMFLEYVVQTLEDDFKSKQTTSALYQSLAKAVLSFDHQFSHIRDVCKWLFSAIVKSTDCNEMGGEHTRIVAIFQRMLSLALEVDCSPAIGSNKLSQELFHMLISSVPPRPQRMLLLESLQSKLLMCKLLEHLLDYSCPVKTSVPMSLSLLLHFLKNCTLSPDPKDGTEKWRRWEELVCLLWMLLLSYNNAMKGYLCGSKTEKRDIVGPSVYKPEDMLSKCLVREAVEAFLSRSQDDVGEALPLHVEESLTYLQDHLLDVCQC